MKQHPPKINPDRFALTPPEGNKVVSMLKDSISRDQKRVFYEIGPTLRFKNRPHERNDLAMKPTVSEIQGGGKLVFCACPAGFVSTFILMLQLVEASRCPSVETSIGLPDHRQR